MIRCLMTMPVTVKVMKEKTVRVPQGQLNELHKLHWRQCELLRGSAGELVA